jgi:hypothetical protein
MSTEHLWNDPEGKLKYYDRNPSQCHFVYHKSHTAWSGIKPGPLEMNVCNRLPENHYGAMHANNGEKLKQVMNGRD